MKYSPEDVEDMGLAQMRALFTKAPELTIEQAVEIGRRRKLRLAREKRALNRGSQ